jgi:hypothetical protein
VEALVHSLSYHVALDSLVPHGELILHSYRQLAIGRIKALVLLTADVGMKKPRVSGHRVGKLGAPLRRPDVIVLDDMGIRAAAGRMLGLGRSASVSELARSRRTMEAISVCSNPLSIS